MITTDRVIGRLELAQMKLLLCNCPDMADELRREIHGLKANLFERRTRDRQYRDRHRAFQRTGVGQ